MQQIQRTCYHEYNLYDILIKMKHILPLLLIMTWKLSGACGRIKFSIGHAERCDEDLKSRVKALRNKAKDEWKNLGGGLLTAGLDKGLEQLNELYPYMQYLCELVFRFDKEFRRQKQERGIVDFNDLEHYTLEILQHAEVAQELQQKYEYIFIDEYQDSNLVRKPFSAMSAGRQSVHGGRCKTEHLPVPSG